MEQKIKRLERAVKVLAISSVLVILSLVVIIITVSSLASSSHHQGLEKVTSEIAGLKDENVKQNIQINLLKEAKTAILDSVNSDKDKIRRIDSRIATTDKNADSLRNEVWRNMTAAESSLRKGQKDLKSSVAGLKHDIKEVGLRTLAVEANSTRDIDAARTEVRRATSEVGKFLFAASRHGNGTEELGRRLWRHDSYWRRPYYVGDGGVKVYSSLDAVVSNATLQTGDEGTSEEHFLTFKSTDFYYTYIDPMGQREKRDWTYDSTMKRYYYNDNSTDNVVPSGRIRVYALDKTATSQGKGSPIHLVYTDGNYNYRYADDNEQISKQRWISRDGMYYFQEGSYPNSIRVYSRFNNNVKAGYSTYKSYVNYSSYSTYAAYSKLDHLVFYSDERKAYYRFADASERSSGNFKHVDSRGHQYFYENNNKLLVEVCKDICA